MSDDIVERLRSTEFASATDGLRSPVIWVKGTVAREAADEIEKLRATLSLAVTSHHEAVNTVISLVAERDTLREATKMALECLEDCDVIGAKQTLAKALGEKE